MSTGFGAGSRATRNVGDQIRSIRAMVGERLEEHRMALEFGGGRHDMMEERRERAERARGRREVRAEE